MKNQILTTIQAIKDGTATPLQLAELTSDFDPYGFYNDFEGSTFEECLITATAFFENELATDMGRDDLIKGFESWLED